MRQAPLISCVMQVTVMDEEAKEGLLQEAGVQAGVPVLCRKEPINALGRMVTSSADAIVLLSTLQDVQDMSSFLKDCHAVLKPGGRCGTLRNWCSVPCGVAGHVRRPVR